MAELKTTAKAVYKHKKNRHREIDNVAGYVFISPFLIGFFAFTLIPILCSLYFSFTNFDLLSSPQLVGVKNYVNLFGDKKFWNSLWITFKFVFVAVPLRLVFSLLVAMLLNKKIKFLGFYRTAFYLPSIVGGSIAISIMWRQLFGNDGALMTILNSLGIHTETSWIGSPVMAIWSLIVLYVWQFGASMLIFLAGLKDIPDSYYEAAIIDGAGPWRKFFSITIPLLTPVIFFNLVMQIIRGFMVFTQAFVITGGGPLESTNVYALYMYRQAFEFHEMGYASAMAWVMLIIVGLFTALIFKSSNQWVFYESGKGGK